MLLLSVGAFSQAPQQISYQAVVRNNNVLVSNSNVTISISIVKDSANGTVVYSELHSATTNANGLFSISIGTGIYQTGSISSINWASGVYFIKSQIDPNGGLNFTITGTSQILSVPYALYAANGTQPGNNVGDMQYWNGSKWVILPAGANGSTLTMSNGVPAWGSGSVTTTLPSVTTTSPSSITSSTAVCGGNVTSSGGAAVTSYGICYATTSNPTTSNSTVQVGAGTGTFSTTVSGLSANTIYYIRAYATNSVGTSYGNQVIITTSSSQTLFAPTVTTTAPSSITSSTAICGGNVISNGGAAVTSYGVCYATTSFPTTSNTTVAVGSGTGSFSTSISGLNSSTTYYVRAYATNSVGTSYGNNDTLITPATTTSYKIGQSYGGGTIFYVDGTGQHGLIVAESDAGGLMPWYNGTYINTGATDTTVGAGAANTATIISNQGSGSYAAYIASQTANGYSDWYLPSKAELELIFTNLTKAGLGNMTKNVYWSSSEYDIHQAWSQDFSQFNTDVYSYYKVNSACVRAIRKF